MIIFVKQSLTMSSSHVRESHFSSFTSVRLMLDHTTRAMDSVGSEYINDIELYERAAQTAQFYL